MSPFSSPVMAMLATTAQNISELDLLSNSERFAKTYKDADPKYLDVSEASMDMRSNVKLIARLSKRFMTNRS